MEQWSELVHRSQFTLHCLYRTNLPNFPTARSWRLRYTMATTTIRIDPVTRLEGHLEVTLDFSPAQTPPASQHRVFLPMITNGQSGTQAAAVAAGSASGQITG